MTDRLLVDLSNRLVKVSRWPEDGLPEQVSETELAWPLDDAALEDLRWYLEDYLRAPFGVWEERGPHIQAGLAGWGETVFASVFGSGPARDAYQRARDHGLELVFRSAEPALLGLPWELMRDGGGPVALGLGGVSRAVPVADLTRPAVTPGGRLRVLMVISRPAGIRDVGFRMVARPMLERLEAVRGQVDLVVLRPPTLDALQAILAEAKAAGQPFQVVHFDGHGVLPGRRVAGDRPGVRPLMLAGQAGEGVLVFERPGGGSDQVSASKVALVLREAEVPVVILNACQSGAVGADTGAAVATRLVRDGAAAVVAMAYSIYAVAAAEFLATFYERLFAGDTIGQAVTAGRKRLFVADGRPSPKGDLPLADWIVPVHYMRRDVAFTQVAKPRPAGEPSLDAILDQMRRGRAGRGGAESLDPVGVFVGRDDEFYELEVAARLARVVVLHGPGGTGKTELAKAFGRWWRDTGGTEKPQWVLFHSFEPGLPSFGLDGVITETGQAVFGPDFALLHQSEQLEAVHTLLEQQRLLLIWDNFESIYSMPDPAGATPLPDEAERTKITRFLDRVAARSRSAVLITSRTPEDWLGPIRRIQVGGLSQQDAAGYADQLLAPYPAAAERRAGRMFGELLEWLDGHPLSMRLILPLLDTSSPAALLDGLCGTTPLNVLGEDQPGAGRLSSLPASITYSFTHLTPATTRLLAAVSLFHDVADADVLADFSQVSGVPGRFAGTTREDWARALDEAAQMGLLTGLGGGIYRIHPALPAYLAARWRANEPADNETIRDAANVALATACAAVCDRLSGQITSGDARSAYSAIRIQRRTLGAILGYALDHQLWDQAGPIARALNAYWEARGLNGEATGWIDRVLAATEQPDGTPPRQDGPIGDLWLFAAGAQTVWQQAAGRLDQAEAIQLRILAMLQALPSTPNLRASVALTCHRLGNTEFQRGQLDEADDWYRQSLAIREELGDQPGLGATYHQLGSTAWRRGQVDRASDWYRQSLAIREELGDQPGLAASYHHLGMTAQRRGRLEEASDWYRQSLAIREELGDQPGLAATYHQLGSTAQEGGRLDEASDWYRKSLAISEELGDRPGMSHTYHQLGITALDQRRLDEADDWYRKSLAIKEELRDRPGMATAFHELGLTAQRRERLDEADDWYRKSLAIKGELRDRPGIAEDYHQLGITSYERGRLDEADDWYRKSLAISEELGDRLGMASDYHELGMTAQARGRLDEADDWYRKSLAISEELGNRPYMAANYAQIGLLAADSGQYDDALALAVRCVSLFGEFPHPMTSTGPDDLVRLTARLGAPALEAAWRAVTGNPLPQMVRDYVTSQIRQGQQ